MAGGPLAGLTVVELAGLAPAPFACTILADLGANVIKVDRAKPGFDVFTMEDDPLSRSRRSIGVDTKNPAGVEIVRKLAAKADVLIEGFRPGVAERMGLGPVDLHEINPGLVYGRVTGWGQDGPLASAAGHDINYIGLAGTLEPIGRAGQRPVPPLNLMGDFGGGGLLLAMGVLAALYERTVSGKGQVVDASMVDGAALLSTHMHGLHELGMWGNPRGENMLDGGAPFYDTYETSDGKYVGVGAIEMRFWDALLNVLELPADTAEERLDPTNWAAWRSALTDRIATKTRDEWTAIAEGTDACLTPVLSPWEAAEHPHNAARGTFTEVDGVRQPAPAPKFDRTPPGAPTGPVKKGSDTATVLAEYGYDETALTELREQGVIS